MDSNHKNITGLVKELVQLQLNKGISPSELMENISTDDYTEISAKKSINGIRCEVKFIDEDFFESRRIKYTYTYIYDNNLYLKEIVVSHSNKKYIEWSREREQNKILSNILIMFDEYKINETTKQDFIKSLPKELYEIVNPYFAELKVV